MITTYKTILQPTESLFKDRGSKFLGFCYPIQKREDIKPILSQLKKDHIKAVHFCFAYRLGYDGADFRANDDGEPSGSAGKPILGQIDSFELTNVLVVVVRYFGGTLLGVPGLINAYKSTTTACFEMAEIVEKAIEATLFLEFDYNLLGEIMNVAKYFDAQIIEQEMALFCRLKLSIPLTRAADLRERITAIYGVKIIE